MKNLEIRNQKLAELRKIKEIGNRKQIREMEFEKGMGINEGNEEGGEKRGNCEEDNLSNVGIGNTENFGIGDIWNEKENNEPEFIESATESLQDLKASLSLNENSSRSVDSQGSALWREKQELLLRKQASEKNQEEIARLQILIQTKKSSISSLSASIKSLQQEKQEIASEVKQTLLKQASLRKSCNLTVTHT